MTLAEEEPFKIIGGMKFGILSPNEIRKMSVTEVLMADTYDEDGMPITSGLMDGRFGTLEPRQRCKTCGNTAARCPGHYGHIELALPVIHPSFAKLIHKLLARPVEAAEGFYYQMMLLLSTKPKLKRRERCLVRPLICCSRR